MKQQRAGARGITAGVALPGQSAEARREGCQRGGKQMSEVTLQRDSAYPCLYQSNAIYTAT